MKYTDEGVLKRFVVFEFEQYYPAGGLRDRTAMFDTVEELEKYLSEAERGFNYRDYVNVLDLKECREVELDTENQIIK